ncbi:hypothetical protein KIPB_016411, partial [Kipferlia bialata]
FTTPGDVDPLTPLSSVVSGIEVPSPWARVDEESSISDDDSLMTAEGQPPTLTLYTYDMTHPIPMDIPVGMLKSLAPHSHIGPLVLSASFSASPPPSAPVLYPTPYPGDAVLADTQYPTV